MTRDEIVEGLKRQIDEWNARIAGLEADLEKRKVESRAEAEKSLAEMKRLRAEAETEIARMRQTSESQWEETRAKGEAALNDIAEGFRRAWSRVS